MKRLQSIPDDYCIIGSYARIVEQIGNSVPSRLAEVIATSVKEQILRPEKRFTYPVRADNFISTYRQRQRANNEIYKIKAKEVISERFSTKVEKEKKRHDKYTIAYMGNLDKQVNENRKRKPEKEIRFLVDSILKDNVLSVDVQCIDAPSIEPLELKIKIAGLDKYFDDLNQTIISADIRRCSDVVRVWAIVQNELFKRSQYYSLTDIYGHYVNRDGSVSVMTTINSLNVDSVQKCIQYFGDSKNCGRYIGREELCKAMGISMAKFDTLLSTMRNLRFDIRTSDTYATIAKDQIVCTYPFPQLHDRSHKEMNLCD